MRISKTSFTAGAITALVLGSGTAFAATGGKMIIGRSNSASTVTTLSNGAGTALVLNSRAGHPSLKVNRTTKVPNLNADLLDGVDQSGFARAAMRTGAFDVAAQGFDSDDVGTAFDIFFAQATCPAGTQRTGGGIADFTQTGVVLWDGPDVGNSWSVAVFVDETVDLDPAAVSASVVCLNPRGGVTGGYRAAPGSSSKLELAKEAAAARAAN